jgi:hypothetical protein
MLQDVLYEQPQRVTGGINLENEVGHSGKVIWLKGGFITRAHIITLKSQGFLKIVTLLRRNLTILPSKEVFVQLILFNFVNYPSISILNIVDEKETFLRNPVFILLRFIHLLFKKAN